MLDDDLTFLADPRVLVVQIVRIPVAEEALMMKKITLDLFPRLGT